jgi:leucyl-tRNA synthetase
MTDTGKPRAPAPSAPPDAYVPDTVEAKWQARWAEQHTNEPDLERAERPFYNLMMFPYPSAEGLHVGNMFAFTGSDVYGRFKRLQGYDVFEPIGYDAFGIHSENYAIKMGINPAILIPKNIENFRRQLKRIGGMFDWRHELSTTDPAYYKWTQWVFLQLFTAGKAYKKSAAVNWCPVDKTVLANEQVINGPWSSGSSGSPSTRTGCWPIWTTRRRWTGRRAPPPRSATGSAGPRAPSSISRSRRPSRSPTATRTSR